MRFGCLKTSEIPRGGVDVSCLRAGAGRDQDVGPAGALEKTSRFLLPIFPSRRK